MPRKGNDMSMIKRVAIALLAIEDSWNDHEWEQLPEGAQALLMALAAIKAMREPTDAMLATEEMQQTAVHRFMVRADKQIWQAMIDAALSDAA